MFTEVNIREFRALTEFPETFQDRLKKAGYPITMNVPKFYGKKCFKTIKSKNGMKRAAYNKHKRFKEHEVMIGLREGKIFW